MCIVHSTLRDATTPYTERYMQASENANPKKAKSLSDTLLFGYTQKKTKLYNKN